MAYYEKFDFFKKYTNEERLKESQRVLKKFPDRFPIMLEKGSVDNIDIKRTKFLVPKDQTTGYFMAAIRNNIFENLQANKAIFIMADNMLIPNSKTLHLIYDEYKADDGFLYLHYHTENTFGYHK